MASGMVRVLVRVRVRVHSSYVAQYGGHISEKGRHRHAAWLHF